jgi:hypothetical protein
MDDLRERGPISRIRRPLTEQASTAAGTTHLVLSSVSNAPYSTIETLVAAPMQSQSWRY